MFAGSCIGVIGLVMSLEFLRRLGKEYDRWLLGLHAAAAVRSVAVPIPGPGAGTAGVSGVSDGDSSSGKGLGVVSGGQTRADFRPSLRQQVIRAALHMLQFAVAYFVMLLAMSYNGYIIICILIGAFVGYFVFGWGTVSLGYGTFRHKLRYRQSLTDRVF